MAENNEIDYKIVLEFDSFGKVAFFLQDLENWLEYKAKKAGKKADDRRGSHIRECHAQARRFQASHPNLPYRECYKLAAELAKFPEPNILL